MEGSKSAINVVLLPSDIRHSANQDSDLEKIGDEPDDMFEPAAAGELELKKLKKQTNDLDFIDSDMNNITETQQSMSKPSASTSRQSESTNVTRQVDNITPSVLRPHESQTATSERAEPPTAALDSEPQTISPISQQAEPPTVQIATL
ncbi:hypothetical protein RN001_001881 [Aquatica leii]|uniref:Uncharacterized protein n=1 Tax=Aquatica leii TaxID=1421715 RepID=A0AAN7PCI4_9COLE|nr:hypothetical protein RN001_001881 [Aquatica leii]